MIRPARPRTSSATSGFFFCGMMLDPVACSSLTSANPNSALVQSTISSASREPCIALNAATNANSATKSRSDTASMLLRNARVSASSSATDAGSIGYREHPLDRRVHVLRVRGPRERAGPELGGDGVESGDERIRVVRPEDALTSEHPGVGDAPAHVVQGDALVELEGRRERPDRRIEAG